MKFSSLIPAGGGIAYEDLGPFSCVPTSFNPDNADMRAFPRALLWRWNSAEQALSAIRPTVVMMRAPLFWQLEQPLWRAAQSNGASIFVNDKDNMPLGRSAMVTGSADTIVTSSEDAVAFSTYLKEKRVPFPRGWIVVHDIQVCTDISTIHAGEETLIFQEVHIFPGMPVLVQCETLAHTRSSLFHAPAGSSLAIRSHVTFSGPADDPLPLTDITLPISLTEQGTCSCGHMTYKIA